MVNMQCIAYSQETEEENANSVQIEHILSPYVPFGIFQFVMQVVRDVHLRRGGDIEARLATERPT